MATEKLLPASAMSAFNWNTGEPSIFANDPAFAVTSSGKGLSQLHTEAVHRQTKATGKNPGTIDGLARAQKSRSPSHYNKAKVR